MTPELEAFLTAADLDDLLSARVNVSGTESEDAEEICRILKEWTDTQAIANILMYPSLIPEDIRLEYILKGLFENNVTYFVLAAIVGLDQIDIGALMDEVKETIINQAIVRIKDDDGAIADRASVFLADNLPFLQEEYSAKIVDLLDHPSDLVKHNILVALISLVGLEEIRSFLDRAVESNQLSQTARRAVEKHLKGIAGFSEDNTVDDSQLNLGSLGVSLLSYIPNLEDWPSE